MALYPLKGQLGSRVRVANHARHLRVGRGWAECGRVRKLSYLFAYVSLALSYVESELNIARPEDWYRVSMAQLARLGLQSLFVDLSDLIRALRSSNPLFPWDESQFVGIQHFGSKLLGALLHKLFPNTLILSDHILSQTPLVTLSYFLPDLKLAFDYQPDKYYGLDKDSGTTLVTLRPDLAKQTLAEKEGISLVFIPFWWDRELGSLASTIMATNPQLKSSMALTPTIDLPKPIPSEAKISLTGWRRYTGSKPLMDA